MHTLPIFFTMVTGGQGVVHKYTIRYDKSVCSIFSMKSYCPYYQIEDFEELAKIWIEVCDEVKQQIMSEQEFGYLNLKLTM